MDIKFCRQPALDRVLKRHQSVNIAPETLSSLKNSHRNSSKTLEKKFQSRIPCEKLIVAVIMFFAAHFALLVGVTTPEKFVFDEVHYVPAARQMLEPVMPQPMLNPMHPPLAKQLIALSIRLLRG